PPEFAPHPAFAAPLPWGGYSMNPLVGVDDAHLVYETALEGIWKHPDRDDYCLLTITGNAKHRDYTLEFSEPPNHRGNCGGKWYEHGINEAGPFSARLVQLGSDSFLDVAPAADTATQPRLYPTLGYVSVHSILRVAVDRKTLWLTEFNDPCRNAFYEQKPTIH